MRISDWSSDVCSSDLCVGDHLQLGFALAQGIFAGLLSGDVHHCAGEALWPALLVAMAAPARQRPTGDAVVTAQPEARRAPPAPAGRSEERRVGKECVSTGRSRGPPKHKKKK